MAFLLISSEKMYINYNGVDKLMIFGVDKLMIFGVYKLMIFEVYKLIIWG